MKRKKTNFFISMTALLLLTGTSVTGYFQHPYGVNAWDYPESLTQMFGDARLSHYRVMVNWREVEPADDDYQWGCWECEVLTRAINRAYDSGVRVTISPYDSPDWARDASGKLLSFDPEEYSEFVVGLLGFAESVQPGIVEAVEILNEETTGTWQDSLPMHGLDQRDPSWYYVHILTTTYQAVKTAYSDILVIMDSIWSGALHHLDELYQLGCKDYFDRINIHYYVQGLGEAEDPSYTGSIWHFPTMIRYLKYLADENEDYNFIWITEYGWRIEDEIAKANYMEYVIDISRKSGFVEQTHLYCGCTGDAPTYPDNIDRAGIIYADDHSYPTFLTPTTAYYMYLDYTDRFPAWDPVNRETVIPLPPASQDVDIVNPGFETGGIAGWEGVSIDSSVKHSGSYSGRQDIPGIIRSEFYPVEKDKLYEIIAWVKVEGASSDACMITLWVGQQGADNGAWYPPNYYGIVDTRNYPNGWRKIRQMYLAYGNQMRVEFGSEGTGTFWVDDLEINALNMPDPVIPGESEEPFISVSPAKLYFGEVDKGETMTLTFDITNRRLGTLAGTISSDEDWIEVNPASFSSNELTVSVTADNSILNQKEGEYTGTVNITSNGGDISVEVTLVPTCVLTKPNPYNPAKGNLTFFGNGIVPGETTIRIYTLSGELVKEIPPLDSFPVDSYGIKSQGQAGINTGGREIAWNGKNEESKPVTNGIYIYTYESPKEKGIGKFTVVR